MFYNKDKEKNPEALRGLQTEFFDIDAIDIITQFVDENKEKFVKKC